MQYRQCIPNYGNNPRLVQEVEQALNAVCQSGYFEGMNEAKLYYEIYKVANAKARIVISHGFCEALEKYHELIYYLTTNQYEVYLVEHRGHGRSGVLGKKDPTQVSVEHFQYYVEDLRIFVEKFVKPTSLPCYLFGHSMGGGIATAFLEQYHGYFQKAVLSSPMLEINTHPCPAGVACVIARIYCLLGKGESYIWGNKPYSGELDLKVSGTSCAARYRQHAEVLRKNEVLQRGGGSFKWLDEAFRATKKMRQREAIQSVTLPVLLFQAGQDTFVKAPNQNHFAKEAPDCTLVHIEEGKHELYFEKDSILNKYLTTLFSFLEEAER